MVEIEIGYEAGGGYDPYGRMVAKNMPADAPQALIERARAAIRR